MDIKKIEQMGMEQGFSHVVLLDCDTIELKPEVRQMCAAILGVVLGVLLAIAARMK